LNIPVPVEDAKKIALERGFDQIIIIARKVGDGGFESVTTYGINKEHCEVAAKTGDFLKYKVMGWEPNQPLVEDRRGEHSS
jgi:hypothetical protein